MIETILAILKEIQGAKTAEEKALLEGRLREAVEQTIRAHFDDARYPKRRRTFGSIRRAVGIYDDKPQELKNILFAMGARTKGGGEGDDTLWELNVTIRIEGRETGGGGGGGSAKVRTGTGGGRGWSTLYVVLLMALVLFGSAAYFQQLIGTLFASIFNLLTGGLEACLADATNALEVDQCHARFSR